jgi:hypothetical protein
MGDREPRSTGGKVFALLLCRECGADIAALARRDESAEIAWVRSCDHIALTRREIEYAILEGGLKLQVSALLELRILPDVPGE